MKRGLCLLPLMVVACTRVPRDGTPQASPASRPTERPTPAAVAEADTVTADRVTRSRARGVARHSQRPPAEEEPDDTLAAFAGMPAIDTTAMNPYESAVLRELSQRAVSLAGYRLKQPITVMGGKVKLVIEGDDDEMQQVTARLHRALGAFVTTLSAFEITMMPKNLSVMSQPVLGAFGVASLKPEFAAGSNVDFDDVWLTALRTLESVPNVELDGDSVHRAEFPWRVTSKWGIPPYSVRGFRIQEQLTMTVSPGPAGHMDELNISIDSRLRMRRMSSRSWQIVELITGRAGVWKREKSESTQDRCLAAIEKALRAPT